MKFSKLLVICLFGFFAIHASKAEDVTVGSLEAPQEEELVEVLDVEPQGHENVAERKTRQFGFPPPRPGFGAYPPYPPPPPAFGGPGFGGGFGGGFGRTRVITRTRTRVVNRYGGFGGGFYG